MKKESMFNMCSNYANSIIKESNEKFNGTCSDINYMIFNAFLEGYASCNDSNSFINIEDKLPTPIIDFEKEYDEWIGNDYYLVKVKNSYPKNCDIIIAEYDYKSKIFYSENSDSPIYDVISYKYLCTIK